MKNKIILPTKIEASDYHEFSFYEKAYEEIGLPIKVDEIGVCDQKYVAIVYSKKDKEYHKLKKQLQKDCDEYQNEALGNLYPVRKRK